MGALKGDNAQPRRLIKRFQAPSLSPLSYTSASSGFFAGETGGFSPSRVFIRFALFLPARGITYGSLQHAWEFSSGDVAMVGWLEQNSPLLERERLQYAEIQIQGARRLCTIHSTKDVPTVAFQAKLTVIV